MREPIGGGGAENEQMALRAVPCQLNLSDCLSIFIFDWDDTLFPTSALVANGPEKLSPAFQLIDQLAAQLLGAALAMPLSHVMLLTSANLNWVYQSARDFLPRVSRLLEAPAENMHVVSAHRPRHEGGAAGGSAQAHEAARRKLEVVRTRAEGLQALIAELGVSAFQAISLGDSPYDLEAAHELARLLRAEASYVKTVAMMPRPRESELYGQLRALSKALEPLSTRARSSHQSMHQAQRQPLAKATALQAALVAPEPMQSPPAAAAPPAEAVAAAGEEAMEGSPAATAAPAEAVVASGQDNQQGPHMATAAPTEAAVAAGQQDLQAALAAGKHAASVPAVAASGRPAHRRTHQSGRRLHLRPV
mmetsp:Transcript_14772/g.44520  ORF Transcript_14772/g.44520 Transcript_14772/m.44520 type:complete len:363 (+) Transcript_14772:92-1180(+)